MNKNWQTNLGGAIGVLGTALLGFGVLSSTPGAPPTAHPQVVWWTEFVGFVLIGFGKAVHALFSADAKTTNAAVADLQNQICQVKSDTATIKKP